MKNDLKIEAFVLAGGKSSRMGSEKGMVLLKGKPLISYVLQSLGRLNLPIKIIARHEGYKMFGLPVIEDVVNEKGPLGGLHTAFHNTKADVVLLISCDMPLISSEAVKLLISEAENDKIVAAEVEGKINPLFALYPTQFKKKAEESLLAEKLKMTDFISENNHKLVPSVFAEMPWRFQNINDPDELQKIEEQWDTLR